MYPYVLSSLVARVLRDRARLLVDLERARSSLGKLALGLRVVRRSGGRPGAELGLARTAVAVLASGPALGLGYLWAFWDDRRQTWHDKVASTYVVRVRD